MQTTETLSQGLKREYQVVLAAAELAQKLDAQLAGLKDKVRINGFRPGKVPLGHLKRLYGKQIMGDVVQEAVTEAQQQILGDNKLRLAGQPKLDFPEDRDEMEKVLEASGDLKFSLSFEILPSFELGAFDEIELERLVAEVPEEEIQLSLDQLVELLEGVHLEDAVEHQELQHPEDAERDDVGQQHQRCLFRVAEVMGHADVLGH